MKKLKTKKISLKNHLGCFSNFDSDDEICRNLCALRLRCVIERDFNTRMEILEELVSDDILPVKIQ